MVEHLPDYAEELEVVNAFVTRETIEDEVRAGAALDAAERQRLEQADNRLLSRHSVVLRRFPHLFSARPGNIPRRYWWWFLDEGPQVREQAREVA